MLMSLEDMADNAHIATRDNADLTCDVSFACFVKHVETEGLFSEKLCLVHVNQHKEPGKVSYHQWFKLVSSPPLNLPYCFFFGIFYKKGFPETVHTEIPPCRLWILWILFSLVLFSWRNVVTISRFGFLLFTPCVLM